MCKVVGLIGFPLKHSISPAFQQAAFDHLGIRARYEAWETPPERVAAVVQQLRNSRYWGMNVTIPHKEAILPLLDTIEPQARGLGAVNTVVNDHGRLVGYNTDATGFLQALRLEGGFDPRACRALVLGAGGVARAVVGALVDASSASVCIVNRNRQRAERLAETIGCLTAGPRSAQPLTTLEVIDWEEPQIRRAVKSVDLIVNCTPMGMRHGPDEGKSPLGDMAIPATALVYDLVYVPAVTPLLRQAQQSGARTLGGLAMLVYQGAAAFELWTGQSAPTKIMIDAATAALGL
jgi:shikimate dehydrogenase